MMAGRWINNHATLAIASFLANYLPTDLAFPKAAIDG
jgi:hypothetical protein